ncbi:MAG: hypothetical protein IT328_03900 [Caldilineaceae bacterium]|nr:hypothetical protein [Caldilineaceae bacterium]
MTGEPGHEPTEWESVSRPTTQSTSGATPGTQAVHYNSARHGSHVEESPELLRWRADLLMDEMMMGGVDVSAADGHRTFSGVDAPVVQRPHAPAPQPPATRPSTNGGTGHGDAGRTPPYERRGHEDAGHANGTHTNGQHHPSGTNGGGYPNRAPHEDFASGQTWHVDPYAVEPPHANPPGGDSRYDERYNSRSAGANPPAAPETADRRAYDEPLRPAPTRPAAPLPLTSDSDARGASSYAFDDESGEHGISAPRRAEPPLRREDGPYVDRPGGDGGDEPSSLKTSINTPAHTTMHTAMDDAPVSGGGDSTARTDRLYNVEQQYEQFRREQSANIQPTTPTPPPVASRPPLTSPEPARPRASTPATPPRVTPQPVDEHTQWATGPDKWEYQDFGANPEEEEPLFPDGYPAPERRLADENSSVRHDPAQFVSAMSVMGNKKRSTLLPRMSTLDVDTLHREISDLHAEIAALLPVGNETGERARHLLDKAYSILQSDPMRSAEVEYYMQQVRTIVQRLHQARQWSDLYRHRLHVYLWGWLGLSVVIVIARFIFQMDMEESLMWITGLDRGSLLVSHWAAWIGAAFAGALGGAIGALYTMRAHARGEHSFFDRKYGLRGLILPLMGLVVGALGYWIFGAIFALVGLDPSQSLTASIIPTVAAFAFGFSQESIYGTRT